MGNPINPNLPETKESFYLRQQFNSHRTILAGLGHQHGRRYIVRETNMADVKMKRWGDQGTPPFPFVQIRVSTQPNHKSAERYVPTVKYIIISCSWIALCTYLMQWWFSSLWVVQFLCMGGMGESKRYYWLITVKPFLSKRYRLGSQFCFKYKFSEKQNVYLVDTCKGPVGVFLKKGWRHLPHMWKAVKFACWNFFNSK